MLASVKPFSSPLYKDAALKNGTLHSAKSALCCCKMYPILHSGYAQKVWRGCIFRGCVNCIEMCMTGSNKTILLIICNEELQKVVERCLRASNAYMQLHTYNS